jgi:hypothetical protein
MNDTDPKDDVPYPNKGIPLTPAIAQYLIKRLFAGKLVERQILVEEVERVHLARGGQKALAATVFKNALGEMKEKGFAENASPGYWRILSAPKDEDFHSTTEPVGSTPAFTSPLRESDANPELKAEYEFGNGAGALYVYYLPTYRLRAQEQGENHGLAKLDVLMAIRLHAFCHKPQLRCLNAHTLQ